jgi:hypothetical protein
MRMASAGLTAGHEYNGRPTRPVESRSKSRHDRWYRKLRSAFRVPRNPERDGRRCRTWHHVKPTAFAEVREWIVIAGIVLLQEGTRNLCMFTFENATGLQAKFVEFYEAGKIACALCHGTSLLRYAKLKNGDYLKGKTVTGFANVEEDFADNAGAD